MQNDINIKNRRASFDYEFLEEYTAGIMLTGTEIKSIRAGKAGLVDSYCYFHNGELWIKGKLLPSDFNVSFSGFIFNDK